MRLLKQALAGFGALVVFGVIVAMVMPKATHAVVAALVQVANTETNPVPTISTNAHNSFVASGGCGFDQTECTSFPLYTVPAGQIAVIDSVSASCPPLLAGTPESLTLGFTSPAGIPTFLAIAPGPAVSGTLSVTQNVTTYAGSGPMAVILAMDSNENQLGLTLGCIFVVSGHLAPQ